MNESDIIELKSSMRLRSPLESINKHSFLKNYVDLNKIVKYQLYDKRNHINIKKNKFGLNLAKDSTMYTSVQSDLPLISSKTVNSSYKKAIKSKNASKLTLEHINYSNVIPKQTSLFQMRVDRRVQSLLEGKSLNRTTIGKNSNEECKITLLNEKGKIDKLENTKEFELSLNEKKYIDKLIFLDNQIINNLTKFNSCYNAFDPLEHKEFNLMKGNATLNIKENFTQKDINIMNVKDLNKPSRIYRIAHDSLLNKHNIELKPNISTDPSEIKGFKTINRLVPIEFKKFKDIKYRSEYFRDNLLNLNFYDKVSYMEQSIKNTAEQLKSTSSLLKQLIVKDKQPPRINKENN